MNGEHNAYHAPASGLWRPQFLHSLARVGQVDGYRRLMVVCNSNLPHEIVTF